LDAESGLHQPGGDRRGSKSPAGNIEPASNAPVIIYRGPPPSLTRVPGTPYGLRARREIYPKTKKKILKKNPPQIPNQNLHGVYHYHFRKEAAKRRWSARNLPLRANAFPPRTAATTFEQSVGPLLLTAGAGHQQCPHAASARPLTQQTDHWRPKQQAKKNRKAAGQASSLLFFRFFYANK